MIIFDLDGTLADCEHRRHFVDRRLNNEYQCKPQINPLDIHCLWEPEWTHKVSGQKWKPDWKSFYEACDKDTPIEPVIGLWNDQISLGSMNQHMIWSGRCESVREKTEAWLYKHLLCFDSLQLRMRPKENTEPDEVLKERWLDEYNMNLYPALPSMNDQAVTDVSIFKRKDPIEFVFDDRPKVIRMWRRHGIFVFNCCQHDEEF